jgi:multidrug resistance protein, MATE family
VKSLPSGDERRLIFRHAWTVWLGQLAVMAFGVADTVVAGRYSNEALAALSIGSAIYISVYVALIGVIQSLLPIFSELHGARQPEMLGMQLKQSVYLGLGLSLAGMLIMLMPDPLLQWTAVPETLHPTVKEYLRVLAFALPASIAFRLYATLHQSIGQPRKVTFIQLLGLGLKLPLSIGLAFGHMGLAEMGAVGCAWATFIVNHVMLVLALGLMKKDRTYAKFQLWSGWTWPNAHALGPMLRLGIPAGLSYLVEVTSFTLMALYVARLGPVSSAAHQITANVTAVLYMLPLSLAIATSARVGYWRGTGSPSQAWAAAQGGFLIQLPLGVGMATLLALAAQPLAGLYTEDPQVAALAAGLLGWVALYHIADGIQAMCGFVLRCYRITVLPFVLYAIFLWGLGLIGGYWLCYHGMPGVAALHHPAAFWITATIALYGVAVCLFMLLIRAVRNN